MAIASKIIAELEIIIESRAAVTMTANGTAGAESYRKVMNKVEMITPTTAHHGT